MSCRSPALPRSPAARTAMPTTIPRRRAISLPPRPGWRQPVAVGLLAGGASRFCRCRAVPPLWRSRWGQASYLPAMISSSARGARHAGELRHAMVFTRPRSVSGRLVAEVRVISRPAAYGAGDSAVWCQRRRHAQVRLSPLLNPVGAVCAPAGSSDAVDGKPELCDYGWLDARQRLLREKMLFRGSHKPPRSPVPCTPRGEQVCRLVPTAQRCFGSCLGRRAGPALVLGRATTSARSASRH